MMAPWTRRSSPSWSPTSPVRRRSLRARATTLPSRPARGGGGPAGCRRGAWRPRDRSTGAGLTVAFGGAATRCLRRRDQRALPGGEGGLALRAGIDAGEPLSSADDQYGTPVIVASGLAAAAADGEILVSEAVRHIAGPRSETSMQPAGALRVPGIRGPLAVAPALWREEAGSAPAGGPAARTISVLIADDQQLVRTGFRVILEAEPDIRVVGEAADGREAVDVRRAASRRRPDGHPHARAGRPARRARRSSPMPVSAPRSSC